MSTTTESDSLPMLPPDDSPGSSVSSCLQDEYQELLQYAVVTPHYDPSQLPTTMAGAVKSFQPHRPIKDQLLFVESTEGSGESSSEASASGSAMLGESMAATRGSLDEDQRLSGSQEEEAVAHPREKDMRRRDLSVTVQDAVLSSPIRSHRVLDSPSADDTPSSDQSTLTNESNSPVPQTIDQDIVKMERLLDSWSLELKRSVLAELSQAKIAVIEKHRLDIKLLKERQIRDLRQLQNELEGQKELLHTFEQSVGRKDQIIANLTRAVQKEKDRFEMLRRFQAWKLRHSEDRRQAFTTKLARRHYEHQLKSRVWSAWHSIIVARWRQRVEKACQTKAQEVCMKLTNDYEARIASLNEALECSRVEVNKLHQERDHYEESMKKAFMRGVCALNMEAMSMFHEGEGGDSGGQGQQQQQPRPRDPSQMGPMPTGAAPQPTPAPSRPVPTPLPAARGVDFIGQGGGGGSRVTASQSAASYSTVSQSQRGGLGGSKKLPSSKSKTVTARVSGRSDIQAASSLGGVGLNPPMASVVVERHHPVTQQTIGHATAARYPAQKLPSSMSVHSSRSGGGPTARKQPQNIAGAPTVKVVH